MKTLLLTILGLLLIAIVLPKQDFTTCEVKLDPNMTISSKANYNANLQQDTKEAGIVYAAQSGKITTNNIKGCK